MYYVILPYVLCHSPICSLLHRLVDIIRCSSLQPQVAMKHDILPSPYWHCNPIGSACCSRFPSRSLLALLLAPACSVRLYLHALINSYYIYQYALAFKALFSLIATVGRLALIHTKAAWVLVVPRSHLHYRMGCAISSSLMIKHSQLVGM